VIKIFEAKLSLDLLGCKYRVSRGIILEEQHAIRDNPAAFVIRNIIQLLQQV
jgi:hypothetical protein